MELLQRLFGGARTPAQPERTRSQASSLSPDERAVERYRYLLRSAAPETIEEAHAEAFSHLTPEQRQLVLGQLSQSLTPAERAASSNAADDPHRLARLATRAELRQPGALERTWNAMPAMPGVTGGGMGGFMMSSFLSTFAGVIVGSAVADAFLSSDDSDLDYANGADATSADSLQTSDSDSSGAVDSGSFGDFGADAGGLGDVGDFGGDFGGDFQ